jgi:hypothetical protein
MASSFRRAVQAAGITADDQHAAESVLGRRHRLARAIATQHTLALQSCVAVLVIAAAGIGLAFDAPLAGLVVAVAAATSVVYVLAWMLTRQVARNRAHDLIADGRDDLVISVVTREQRRLASRKERERLARSLEAFHRDAQRWHQILPQLRPPHGVVQLRHLTAEVEALSAALRRDRVRARGVALAERLITDGCESPLYADEREPLREELNRIRYLLECGGSGARDAERTEERAA